MSSTWDTPISALHEQPRLMIGRLELDARHPAWHTPCRSPGFTSVAFPRVPVATHAEGAPEELGTQSVLATCPSSWAKLYYLGESGTGSWRI